MKNKDKTHYYDLVYDVVRLIPKGRVCSYGVIANFLTLGSARMVGWALNNCHKLALDVPAHRIVNRKGELSGRLHFSTPTKMQELLESEGIEVIDNKIIEFERLLVYPESLME